jgi:hypothetical protein
MVFPEPTLMHDVLDALPNWSPARPSFPLFLHGTTLIAQVIGIGAVLLSRDRMVDSGSVVFALGLWALLTVVYWMKLRVPAHPYGPAGPAAGYSPQMGSASPSAASMAAVAGGGVAGGATTPVASSSRPKRD